MGEQSKNHEPRLARTDFESMTHEQLAALLDSANTAGASHLSSKLSKAASTITKIGDDLMTYVKGLEWQGEGGDAFRDWGGQTASSTLRLGQYAEVASRWMGTVSQAIAEAKAAMPDVSETTRAKTDLADAHKTINVANQPGAHHDPDAQKLAATAKTDAAAAQHRIEAARGEAIQQMQKLAQTYEFSAQQVNSVAPPTFSPPADHLEPNQWIDNSARHVSVGSDGSTTASGLSLGQSGQGSVGTQHGTTHTVPQSVAAGGAPEVGQARFHRPAATEIDSVGTLPRTSEPTTTTPASPEAGAPHRGVFLPNQPTVLPPAFGRNGQVANAPSPGRVPSSSGVPKAPTPGMSGGGTTRLPQEAGITGGRPVSSNPGRAASGIPRGTVIGKEGTQNRAPLGRGMSPGSSVGQGSRPGNGLVGGRRLASETGGAVGNRSGRPGRGGGRPFTAGGSGLVRPSSSATDSSRSPVSGRVPAAGRPARTRAEQQQEGARPDYLVEEEETWRPDSRRALPPVVD
jgi:hypothetical protein